MRGVAHELSTASPFTARRIKKATLASGNVLPGTLH